MPDDNNEEIIEEFRANGGQVTGFAGIRTLLLLTTFGRHSGTSHTVPLIPIQQDSDLVIFASNAGAEVAPDWYYNILDNPNVVVEFGAQTFGAKASVLDGADRDRMYARRVEMIPQYAGYQEMAKRVIPVLSLHDLHEMN
ncbi:nitroreductase/quinone reductase family protein [Kribbella sp. NPDC004536]|uniref:nitroreductase/quinone reductase family protein n=1 Tax=Kribbella sp. NPDC004536 TaxID=3364106 RepID=UPI0036931E8A